MKTYVMKCGCRLTREELIRRKNGSYGCPHHPASGTKSLELDCIDCGKTIFLSPKNSTAVRCEKCRVERVKARQKVADAKRRDPHYFKKLEKMETAAVDAWDCVNRNACLSEAMMEYHAKFLPCYGCDRYAPIKTQSYHTSKPISCDRSLIERTVQC